MRENVGDCGQYCARPEVIAEHAIPISRVSRYVLKFLHALYCIYERQICATRLGSTILNTPDKPRRRNGGSLGTQFPNTDYTCLSYRGEGTCARIHLRVCLLAWQHSKFSSIQERGAVVTGPIPSRLEPLKNAGINT